MELVETELQAAAEDEEPIDEEVAAIAVIVDAFSPLAPDAQARVLTYLNDRYSYSDHISRPSGIAEQALLLNARSPRAAVIRPGLGLTSCSPMHQAL
jgi:hypothetical protein